MDGRAGRDYWECHVGATNYDKILGASIVAGKKNWTIMLLILHAYLQVNTRENGDEVEVNLVEDVSTLFSSVTLSLKSRKQQRKGNDKTGSKKMKTDTSSNHFVFQAEAANRQIATQEKKNMIDLLRLMQESTVYSHDEMKEKFLHAEKKILGVKEQKPSPIEVDSDVASWLGSELDESAWKHSLILVKM